MTDQEFMEEFRKINNRISEVKSAASDKGHFFIICLLIMILLSIGNH